MAAFLTADNVLTILHTSVTAFIRNSFYHAQLLEGRTWDADSIPEALQIHIKVPSNSAFQSLPPPQVQSFSD